jgi:hypothetical protein
MGCFRQWWTSGRKPAYEFDAVDRITFGRQVKQIRKKRPAMTVTADETWLTDALISKIQTSKRRIWNTC